MSVKSGLDTKFDFDVTTEDIVTPSYHENGSVYEVTSAANGINDDESVEVTITISNGDENLTKVITVEGFTINQSLINVAEAKDNLLSLETVGDVALIKQDFEVLLEDIVTPDAHSNWSVYSITSIANILSSDGSIEVTVAIN